MIATLFGAVALLLILAFPAWWVMRRIRPSSLKWLLLVFLGLPACAALLLIIYIVYYLFTPAGELTCQPGNPAIELTRIVKRGESPAVITIAKLNLQKLTLVASPPNMEDPQFRYSAMTTSSALQHYGGLLAVNASFFRPFRDKHLFDYYPHAGDLVDVIGKTVFAQQQFGAFDNRWPALSVANGHLRIGASQDWHKIYPEGLPDMAVSAKSLLVKDGIPVALSDSNRYPRTAVGLDKDGKYLWMIVADGKQPLYSKGVDLEALAEIMVALGVHDGLELDGGGSATMAVACQGKVTVINRPSHTNLPARERPVANHLIVRER